jgi:hypothetical protein
MTGRRYRLDGHFHAGDLRVLRNPLSAAGWKPTDGDDWNLWWSHGVPQPSVYEQLSPGRWVNHIPGILSLTRKDRLAGELAAAVDRVAARGGSDEGWHPATYLPPGDRRAYLRAVEDSPDRVWIQKPRGAARGEGVALVADTDAAARLGDQWVIQEYLADPHLIDGYKYTLRFYVVITSVVPLVVYVFDEGFTKFASRPFSFAVSEDPRFAHLTNPDVLALDQEVPTSSRNLLRRDYERLLRSQGVDVGLLFGRINEVIASTVAAVRERLVAGLEAVTDHPAGCFELLGLDVLVDSAMKPWLIECNLAPSLEVEASPAGRAAREEAWVKQNLVSDLAALVGLTAERPGPDSERVGGFRRIFPSSTKSHSWSVLALPRSSDQAVAGEPERRASLVPQQGCEHFELENSLVVQGGAEGRVYMLNGTAAYTWMRLTEGLSGAEIAAEIAAHTEGPLDQVASDIESLCATWLEAGLMIDADRAPRVASPSPPAIKRPHLAWNLGDVFSLGRTSVSVRAPDSDVLDAIRPALGALRVAHDGVHHHMEISRARSSLFSVRVGGALSGPPISLEQLGSLCRGEIIRLAAADTECPVFFGSAVAVGHRACLVLGAASRRAQVLQGWSERGNEVTADAVVQIVNGAVSPLHLGVEHSVDRRLFGTSDRPAAFDKFLLDERGRPIQYSSVPSSLRGTLARPVTDILVLDRQAQTQSAISGVAAFLALMRARPAGVGGLAPNTTRQLVDTLGQATAWTCPADSSAADETIGEIFNRLDHPA